MNSLFYMFWIPFGCDIWRHHCGVCLSGVFWWKGCPMRKMPARLLQRSHKWSKSEKVCEKPRLFIVLKVKRPTRWWCSSMFAPSLVSPAVREKGVWWSVWCLDAAQPDPESTDGGGKDEVLLVKWRRETHDDTLTLMNILHRSQKSIRSQSTKPKCTKKARKGELTRGTLYHSLSILVPQLKLIHLGKQLHYQGRFFHLVAQLKPGGAQQPVKIIQM